MKLTNTLLLSVFMTTAVYAEPTSETEPKLKQILERRPELDKNKDGTLTLTELRESRNQTKKRPTRKTPPPTFADVSYGPHASMKLDFWKAKIP